jgi:hypothetical protein
VTVVFDAANTVEAHMIVHLLQQAGIEGRIDGEHLQGGMGELPAAGNIRVRVSPENVAEARSVISEWEAIQPAEWVEPKLATSSHKLNYFLIGAAFATGILFLLFRSPVSSQGIDYDGDGKFEQMFYYRGNVTSKVEIDRNRDGEFDGRWLYDMSGIVESYESDDDFDGVFETSEAFREGIPVLATVDTNGDGQADIRHRYKSGVFAETEFLDPVTGRVKRLNRYALGKLTESELDTDGDGEFDIKTVYDEFEQPIRESVR